ncbi:MAG: hypothetical protein HY236_08920 [Acidobacteria bacterium]|nr:hypothetical protein [Acidobacteriota bacterium]
MSFPIRPSFNKCFGETRAISFLFKYPPAVFEKGQFVFLSGWGWGWLVGLIAAAAAGLGWHIQQRREKLPGLRRALIWGFETALAALLLALLWRPAVRVDALRPQQNVIAVLVDTSKSMNLKESDQSRLEKVQQALSNGWMRELQNRFQVRLYGFSSHAGRVDGASQLAAGGNATRLGESLAGVLRETSTLPVGGVVLFSDGSDNAGGVDRTLMAEIRQRRIPVHAVGVGRTDIPRDVELAEVAIPARALPGSRLNARLTLRHHGLDGEKARLSIREGSKILAAREVELRARQGVQNEVLVFQSGDPGLRRLTIAVDPLPGEEITGNNVLTRLVEVPSGRRRILYLEGEPRWEFKFIRRAAEEDPSIHLVSLLRTTGNKFYRQGVESEKTLAEGFPTTAAELFDYQALIIGTVEANFFTPAQQDLIREFVNRRGGAVLFLGGRRSFGDGGWASSSLAEILPVRISPGSGTFHRQPVKVELTPQGRESLVCRLEEDPEKNAARWAKLPDLADYQTTGDLKPGAVAWVNALLPGSRSIPMLALENYGRGLTMVFATGGSWRWRMRLDHKDTTHATFWQQLLRSLVASTPGPVTVTSDRLVYADETRVKLRAEVRTKTYEPANNATVVATVTGEDGRSSTLELHPSPDQEGIYEGELTAEKTGSYRAEVVAHRTEEELGRETLVFHREDGVAENFHPEQNRELLQKIAQQTGGRYWKLEEVGRLAKELPFSAAGITTRETRDLWDMPAVFLLILGIRAAEWLLRRKWGAV